MEKINNLKGNYTAINSSIDDYILSYCEEEGIEAKRDLYGHLEYFRDKNSIESSYNLTEEELTSVELIQYWLDDDSALEFLITEDFKGVMKI